MPVQPVFSLSSLASLTTFPGDPRSQYPGNASYFHFKSETAAQDAEENFSLFPGFLQAEEGKKVEKIALRKLKRSVGLGYEEGHFDGRIHGYRECSVSHWPVGPQEEDFIQGILHRMTDHFDPKVKWLSPHILELKEGGGIDFHVDNHESSGGILVGLSLVSTCVMHLRHREDHERAFSVLLPPNSLYIQRGACRYVYEHAIPADGPSRTWANESIPPARRISLMMRVSPMAVMMMMMMMIVMV